MTRFYELLKECNEERIKYYMKEIFKYEEKQEKSYLKWLKKLSKIKPKLNECTLFCTKEKYYDAFFIETDNIEDKDKIEHYSLITILFPQLLGMYAFNDGLSIEEYVSDILYENTFFGFTDRKKKKELRKIRI